MADTERTAERWVSRLEVTRELYADREALDAWLARAAPPWDAEAGSVTGLRYDVEAESVHTLALVVTGRAFRRSQEPGLERAL